MEFARKFENLYIIINLYYIIYKDKSYFENFLNNYCYLTTHIMSEELRCKRNGCRKKYF